MTYVPYDPSFEMPDEGGGFNGRLTGDSTPDGGFNPYAIKSSRVQLAVSKWAHSLLELQGSAPVWLTLGVDDVRAASAVV